MTTVQVRQKKGGSEVVFDDQVIFIEGADRIIAGFIGLYLALDYTFYEPVCCSCWETVIQAKAATFKTRLSDEIPNAQEIFNLIGEAEDFFEQIKPSKRNELIHYCK